MANEYTFTNFIAEISDEKGKSEILRSVKAVEKLLGDSRECNARIVYLESLTDNNSSNPVINDPLTHDQHIKCVEKGLSKAYKDGDITAEQVARLAHSVDGIRAFADTLTEVPELSHAKCWKKVFNSPRNIPGADLSKIIPPVPHETLIEQLTKLANQWLDIVAPPKLSLVPGLTRGISVSAPRVNLRAEVEQSEIIMKQLASLRGVGGKIPDKEIVKIWGRIPWTQIREALRTTTTWEEFLKKAGMVFHTELSYSDIEILNEWVERGGNSLSGHRSEMKLLEILLRASEMVRM